MIRSIAFLLAAAFVAIINIPEAIYWHFRSRKDKAGAYDKASRICRRWIGPVQRLGGVNLRKLGEENIPKDRAVLYVGNHQGDMDILLIMHEFGELPSVVAKIETKKIPVVSTWMASADCIFMDRGNARQTLECIKRAQELLESGRSVVIFPEGTRAKGPDMREFKAGALRCALKAKVSVVPFAIDGTYKVFERQRYLKKADVDLSILPPIEPEEFAGLKTHELAQMAQQRIQDELYRLRETRGEEVPPAGERKQWNEQESASNE